MSRIKKDGDVPTFRIDLIPTDENPGPDWVDAKTALRTIERDQMNAGLVKTDFNPDTEEATPRIDTSRSNTLRLLAYIVDWGGPGFTEDGKLQPINETTIGNLDEDTSAYILRMIKLRNPRPVPPKGPANAVTPDTKP